MLDLVENFQHVYNYLATRNEEETEGRTKIAKGQDPSWSNRSAKPDEMKPDTCEEERREGRRKSDGWEEEEKEGRLETIHQSAI